jgi:hypothetical protein
MRTPLLLLITTVGITTTLRSEAATPSASPSAADFGASAVWTQRKLVNFKAGINGQIRAPFPSRDGLVGGLSWVLFQLGARVVHIDERGCLGGLGDISIDATFLVLPADNDSGHNAIARAGDTHWQSVEIRTAQRDCGFLRSVTEKVLPLFSAREVKLIPKEVCEKTDVGLSAQVLMPAPQVAESRQGIGWLFVKSNNSHA